MWVWGWGPRGGWSSWLLNKKELTRPNSLSGAGWGEWQMGEEKAEHPDWHVRASMIHSTINWHLPGTIPDTGTQRWTRPSLARECLLSTGLSARGLIGGTDRLEGKVRVRWVSDSTISCRCLLGLGVHWVIGWYWKVLKGEVALASLCVGCGGLILYPLPRFPKLQVTWGGRRGKEGLSRRSKKQDKGKLSLNLSFCTSVRVWIGLLVYEPPLFFSW